MQFGLFCKKVINEAGISLFIGSPVPGEVRPV